jgi:hypothetical protein
MSHHCGIRRSATFANIEPVRVRAAHLELAFVDCAPCRGLGELAGVGDIFDRHQRFRRHWTLWATARGWSTWSRCRHCAESSSLRRTPERSSPRPRHLSCGQATPHAPHRVTLTVPGVRGVGLVRASAAEPARASPSSGQPGDSGCCQDPESLIKAVALFYRDRLSEPAGGDRPLIQEPDAAEQHEAVAVPPGNEPDRRVP